MRVGNLQALRDAVRQHVDPRIRDSVWALRTRGDSSVLSATVRGILKVPYRRGSNGDHLSATMAWLCAAQDVLPNGGVSAFYDVRTGTWAPAYPETTGYIIPTFFDFASACGGEEYSKRAVRMADWLLTLQLEDGAFPIGPLWPDWPREPIVFDTGQIIHGLLTAFEEVHDLRYLVAARRAGDWLSAVKSEDGCWRRFTSLGHAHAYNSRTAWALVRLAELTDEHRYRDAAVANLHWVMTQQTSDGWFNFAGFTPDEDPLTHTIAYTIEGLLESGVALGDARMVAAARKAADGILRRQAEDGFLRARYGRGWKSQIAWSCLTGNAQMAIIWMRLFQLTADKSYLLAATQANGYIKRRQSRNSGLAGVTGGVAGSAPIYEGYEPYRLLNWAAKFFADSLLLDERIRKTTVNDCLPGS